MKYILRLLYFALPLVCGAHVAMAFTPGLPPHSGPGSVFYGQPEKGGGGHAVPTHKSQRKHKQAQQGSGSRLRHVLPKPSQ